MTNINSIEIKRNRILTYKEQGFAFGICTWPDMSYDQSDLNWIANR